MEHLKFLTCFSSFNWQYSRYCPTIRC